MTSKNTYRPPADIIPQVLADARPNFEIDDEGKKRRVNRCLRRGMPNRRLIAEKTIDGIEYGFHATKGWRARYAG